MITVRLMGGLGNQMFQYALGLSLSIKNNNSLILDKFYLENRKNLSLNSVIRNYDLDIFSLNDDVAIDLGHRQFLKRNINKLIPIKYRSYYIEPHFNYDSSVFNLKRTNLILEGYWQSFKYFQDIEDALREKFYFKYPLLESSVSIYQEIDGTESVCLNIRRGDFLTDKVLGFKDLDYFKAAICKLEDKLKSKKIKYFIFSDDIKWCSDNFRFIKNKLIVDHSHKGYKFSNYLQLMISCKHFIIPNSSFGWWAAYLSNNTSKIVIAPESWFLDTNLDTSDLIPGNWLRV